MRGSLRSRLELIQIQLPVISFAILVLLVGMRFAGGVIIWDALYFFAGSVFAATGVLVAAVGLIVSFLSSKPLRTWIEALGFSGAMVAVYAALFRVLVVPFTA
jgi:hypothetical protein